MSDKDRYHCEENQLSIKRLFGTVIGKNQLILWVHLKFKKWKYLFIEIILIPIPRFIEYIEIEIKYLFRYDVKVYTSYVKLFEN